MSFLAMGMLNSVLAATPWTTGTAYSVENGSIAYRELHYSSPEQPNASSRVEYMDPQGQLIVTKQLDFSHSQTAPALDQVDLRTRSRIFTRYENDLLHTGYQRSGDDPLRTGTVKPAANLIIDAGFDSYVRSQWLRLLGGRGVTAAFYVPSRLGTIMVSIAPVSREECADVQGEVLCLMIKPAGLLRVVSWLVEPLRLAYDVESQRLLMFRGLSNLLDNAGQPQDVVVLFEYAQGNTSGPLASTGD